MAYGLKYSQEYTTTGQDTCRVEIYLNHYTNPGFNLPLVFTGNPVVQHYQTDEARPFIKGCSLSINLQNVNGDMPITTFYSDADDDWKVIHYKNDVITFVGFVVLDDSIEELADYTHDFTLTANDNLGLLKDVLFDVNASGYAYSADIAADNSVILGTNAIFIKNSGFVPLYGRPFVISGHASLNGTYNIVSITLQFDGTYQIIVAETVVDTAYSSGVVEQEFNLYGRNTLAAALRICLISTGCELGIKIMVNLYEDYMYTGYSMFEQTVIDFQTFLNDKQFQNCNDVLETILTRLNATIFQAGGFWYIVRWDELRYGAPRIFTYDQLFNYQSVETFDNTLSFGFEQPHYPEVGANRQVVRPLKYAQESFDYTQPKYLLLNNDLQDLGDLLRTYTTGSGVNLKTFNEYVFTDWTESTPPPPTPGESFIRVVLDYLGNELERYVVVRGYGSINSRVAQSHPIEVSAGDKITFTYTFKTLVSQPGNLTYQLSMILTDGTLVYYADEDKTINWQPVFGWRYDIPTGDNSNVDHTVTIDPGPVPFDGVVYVYLPQAVFATSPTTETQIKNITLKYEPAINAVTNIIGHIHLNDRDVVIKNTAEETLRMDDTPRNSLKGTLFKTDFAGVLQKRTERWYRFTNDTERLRLGQITTFEELFYKRVPRTKIQGTFYGLENLSLLAQIVYPSLGDLQFIFGSLEINFAFNSFNCTLYEMYQTGEVDANLTSDYTFTYLYDSK